jgi:hypothetical protein
MISPYHLGQVGIRPADCRTSRAPTGEATAKKNAAPVDAEQSRRVQSGTERWVPLSVPEICRLLWRLVLATKQPIGHILDWSAWRRWHQGMAPYYHYKRRTDLEVQL